MDDKCNSFGEKEWAMQGVKLWSSIIISFLKTLLDDIRMHTLLSSSNPAN